MANNSSFKFDKAIAGYNNVRGARLLDPPTRRIRPKAKSNFALIKQIKANG